MQTRPSRGPRGPSSDHRGYPVHKDFRTWVEGQHIHGPTSLRASLKQKRVFITTGPRDLGDTELNVLEVKPQTQERAQAAIVVKGTGGE